jgi:transposase
MLVGMQAPPCVRPLTAAERTALEAGRHTGDRFTVRRCQIVLASARQLHPPAIAELLGCHAQTVRNTIHAFEQHGVAALRPGSSRPHSIHAAFDAATAEQLRDLLHRSPRDFGQPTSVWTLELAAEVAYAAGVTATRVSDETIRATLARLGVGWRRAKQWITCPDPGYQRKKGGATG